MAVWPLGMLLALVAELAGAAGAGSPAPRGQLELGIGASCEPDYSGGGASGPRALLWAGGEYRSDSWGAFALDSGSLTLDPQVRWTFSESSGRGFGLLLGYREGRSESDPGWLGDAGSARLRGLGSVESAVDAGLQGYVKVFGVPFFAQVRAALNGDQGTLAVIGLYLPFQVSHRLDVIVLPSLTWGDATQMRAMYGVTPAQAASSGFATFQPGAGWRSTALELVGDWEISGPWRAIASVACQRLLGSAARSPLTQDRNGFSGLVGLAYRLQRD